MEQSERNPDQDSDRGRAPGHPSVDRADELRERSRQQPDDEKGRDRPPEDAPRDPNDPWMGGG
jgi:hypothetical protein